MSVQERRDRRRAPLTSEMVRILRACRDGRLKLRIEPQWRWTIEGEDLPNSRERKLCESRGLISKRWDREAMTYVPSLTERGEEELAEAGA